MELESVPDVSSVLASHIFSSDGLLYQYDRNGYQALASRTIAGMNGHRRVVKFIKLQGRFPFTHQHRGTIRFN